MRRYIGFAGKAGAGKNYVADLLERMLWGGERTTEQIAFAAEVRKEIEEVLGVGHIPALWVKPTPEPVRRLLQFWGTDYRRAEDPDYWVKRGVEAADRSVCDVILFTDVRFANEADGIRDLGGIVVHVEASEAARVKRIGITPNHASEVIDFGTDVTVDNSTDKQPSIPKELIAYAFHGERKST